MTFNFSTFLFQIVNFLVLLYILRRFVYVPLYRVMDARRAAIASAQEQAQRALEEASALRAQVQQERDAIQHERALMLEESRSAIASERERAASAARESTEQQRAAFERELAEAQRRAVDEVSQELSSMAVGLVERLLQQIADVTLHEQLCRRLAEVVECDSPSDRPRWQTLAPDDEPMLDAARRVDPAVLERLGAALRPQGERPIAVVVRVDPGLIAGARLRHGGRVWDASLAGLLQTMRNGPREDSPFGIPDISGATKPAAPPGQR